MFQRLRKRLTVPNAALFVAVLALFSAMGGPSYAATLITSSSIANGTILSADVKNGAIRTADIKNETIRSADVKNGVLLRKDFKPGQLPAAGEGASGAPGEKGDTGAQGEKGNTGAQGEKGETAGSSSTVRTASEPIPVSCFTSGTQTFCNGQGTVTALCNPGEHATGGSVGKTFVDGNARSNGSSDEPNTTSGPATGWTAEVVASSSSGARTSIQSPTVYVVCAS